MSNETICRKATEAFIRNTEGDIDSKEYPLPDHPVSRRQIQIYKWARSNFGGNTEDDRLWNTLGVSEEVGELFTALLKLGAASGALSHATLKTAQGIRGFDNPEKARAAVSDALADIAVFSAQVATAFQLDFGVLFDETLEEVLQRNWKKDPLGAHKSVSYLNPVDANGTPVGLGHLDAPYEVIKDISSICDHCGAAHPEKTCSGEF